MKQFVTNIKVKGTGSYVPETVYTNRYLESIAPTNADWIEQVLGIKERHIAFADQPTSDLAALAGQRAIEDACMEKEDIGLLIVATVTPDRLMPSTAAIVQRKLNLSNAAAFDISAACSGFLYALSVAMQYIAGNVYRNILVIGADTFTKITDWEDRNCVYFGDGAGAIVLSVEEGIDSFASCRLYTDGNGCDEVMIPAGGSEMPASQSTLDQKMHFFRMNGKAVFNAGTTYLPKAIHQVLEDVGWTVNDVDYFIPHQPNKRLLEKTCEIINLPLYKLKTNMDKYANTSAGTIPILLDEVNKTGVLTSGKHILLAAIGSGWTYGAAAIKWA